MKRVACVVALCCLLNVVLCANLPRKQLAGPPSEFEAHRLPTPDAGALTEGSAMFRPNFATYAKENALGADSTVVYQQKLLVDSTTRWMLSFFSPHSKKLKLSLANPSGEQVSLQRYAHQDHFPNGGMSMPGTTYIFPTAVVGEWTLTVELANTQQNLHEFLQSINKARAKNQLYDAGILLWNESPFQMYTHLNTYNLQAGAEVGLVTTITDQAVVAGGRVVASRNVSSISIAQMDVVLPDGQVVDVNMKDDGLSYDGVANDGTYGAYIVADEVGNYEVQAVIKGVRADGVAFVRTTQHVVAVTSADLKLKGTAVGVMKSSSANRMNINLAVDAPANFPRVNPKFRAYAEVYGTAANGKEVAVCWISSIVNVITQGAEHTLTLELDLNWLALANAVAPLVLKNVYVQDAYTMIPLSQVAEIPVTAASTPVLVATRALGQVTEISREMREGVMPAHIVRLLSENNNNATDTPVVLVHGYCAGSNPWAASPSQWTNPLFFSQPQANLMNEDFAEAVANFAEAKGATKFSVVGHSQGGIVGTHLLNYYFTGMDAVKGRKVQSVGTPYLGCGGAGSAANLIKVFGYGCGENFDLTHDGSNLWLAGIATDIRKDVYYYTTTYKQGNLFGDWCNLAVNTVLAWPNDGTTELKYAALVGGNNMGNKEKWCHTTEMGYPAQYTDAARNAEMNAAAAR